MAEDNLMPSSQPTAPHSHRGSASTTLSGRKLLATWLLSIAIHGGGLVVMFLLVFPFASRGLDDLPIAKLDIVGPLDADPSPGSFRNRLRITPASVTAALGSANGQEPTGVCDRVSAIGRS